MTSNPEFDRRSDFQPGVIVTVALNTLKRKNKEKVDLMGNIRLVEAEYRGTLGIFTLYRPQKVDGPTQVHTQAVNRIRQTELMEELIHVEKFLYDDI